MINTHLIRTNWLRALALAACVAFGLSVPDSCRSAPWMATDDAGLRLDIETLADTGVLDTPIMTWPINWVNVKRAMSRMSLEDVSGEAREAYSRVNTMMRIEMQRGVSAEVGVGGATSDQAFRPFGSVAADQASAEGKLKWLGEQYAGQLSAVLRGNPSDGDAVIMDGSYVAGIYGNWIVSVGKEGRWWGPSWRDSLILGTNARPMTGLSVRRNSSEKLETSWLGFLGPWNFETMINRFDDDPLYNHPLLWGVRFSMMPRSDLEIAITRTAEWGGGGRPAGFRELGKIVVGLDNEQHGASDQVANQLGGFDVRWRSPIGSLGYAVYAQWIGEDEAGALPSKYIGLAGLEVFDWRWFTNRTMRMFFEVESTQPGLESAMVAIDQPQNPNVAYEHTIYRAGYRHLGRSIGSSLDNDSLAWSLGALINGAKQQLWRLDISWIALNRDNKDIAVPGGSSVSNGATNLTLLAVETQLPSWRGRLAVGGSLQSRALNVDAYKGSKYRLYAKWTMR